MNMMMEYISVGLALIVLGLMLKHWQPPIKKQYQFMILAIVGVTIGCYSALGPLWGFIVSGLVFYKGEVVDEFHTLKEGLTDITDGKD